MKKIIFVLLLVPALFLIPSSCKKGDNDPFISFRSRKARIVNDWTCKTINAQHTFSEPSGTDVYSIGYSGSNISISDSDPATPSSSLSYSFKLKIEKNGKFTAMEYLDGEMNYVEGNWNFNGKIGEDKNKESVTLNITRSTMGTDVGIFFVMGGTFTCKIKELRDKRMVLEIDSFIYADADSSNKMKGEFIFE
jgi:hypothetical protein